MTTTPPPPLTQRALAKRLDSFAGLVGALYDDLITFAAQIEYESALGDREVEGRTLPGGLTEAATAMEEVFMVLSHLEDDLPQFYTEAGR